MVFLIKEVLDFKKFIIHCIAMEENALLEHTKAQQFKFYIDAAKCSVMKYKLLCMNDDWLSQDSEIKLWKDPWPRGFPLTVQPSSMQIRNDIKCCL